MNYDWASDMHVRMGITTPEGLVSKKFTNK